MNLSEVKIKYKKKKVKEYTRISNPNALHSLLLELVDKDTLEFSEQAIVIFLDNSLAPISFHKQEGTCMNSCRLDPKIIFSKALLAGAISLIVAHNHPSGNMEPSSADTKVAKILRQAGDVIDIKMLDFVIFSKDRLYSFENEGLL